MGRMLAVLLAATVLGGAGALTGCGGGAAPSDNNPGNTHPPITCGDIGLACCAASTCTSGLVCQTGECMKILVSGTFTATGDMSVARRNHTATLLPNGKVLITGGDAPVTHAIAELYDPATRKFKATGNPIAPRDASHTSTLLLNGSVLIAGGTFGCSGLYGRTHAELYEPATEKFTETGIPTGDRCGHTATLLLDGKVLLAGGLDGSPYYCPAISTAELYDPTTGAFAPVGNMTQPRVYHQATMLPDGKVLITGGGDNCVGHLPSAEIFDPKTGQFSFAGDMSGGRSRHFATQLPSKLVLVAGCIVPQPVTIELTGDLYDPVAQTFSTTGGMNENRESGLAAALLDNGKVLFTGGSSGWATAELFDPATGKFTFTGEMATTRTSHAATLLLDGTVLVTGGLTDPGGSKLRSAELYKP